MRDDDKRQTLKVELLSQWKPEAEFLNICASLKLPQKISQFTMLQVLRTLLVLTTLQVLMTLQVLTMLQV